MITIFSAMRPFRGEAAPLQHNAIRSWLAVQPACDVVLVDDEEHTTAAAVAGLPVRVVSGVRRSALGVPLFDALIDAGAQHARGGMLACTTADVLFPPNFAAVVESVAAARKGGAFLLVCSRHDLRRAIDVDFGCADWFEQVRVAVETESAPFPGIDVWVHPASVRLSPPSFPIGRHGTDGWMVWEAKRRGIPVIDATPDVCLAHQYHTKPATRDPRYHQEMLECVRLFPRMAENAMSVLDADWLWRDGRLVRPRGLRRLHASMSLFRPYRFLVGRRRRFKLPHLYGAVTGLAQPSRGPA